MIEYEEKSSARGAFPRHQPQCCDMLSKCHRTKGSRRVEPSKPMPTDPSTWESQQDQEFKAMSSYKEFGANLDCLKNKGKRKESRDFINLTPSSTNLLNDKRFFCRYLWLKVERLFNETATGTGETITQCSSYIQS